MLCKTCKHRSDCIPAALAANDSYMYALLERLKKCDRYLKDQQMTHTATNDAGPGPLFAQHPA